MFSPKIIFALILLPFINYANASEIILKDAHNFAELFKKQSHLTPHLLQTQYLDIGSKGIEIFTPRRIKSAENMFSMISNNKHVYNQALDICLPQIESLKSEALQTLNETQKVLSQTQSAPVYIVFGANNSGGTASENGLVLGLEVLCSLAQSKEEFKNVFMNFIAHEITHVYQNRAYVTHKNKPKPTLLFVSLHEGIADFVSGLVLNNISNAEILRHTYGLKHEKQLWKRFKSQMNGTKLGDWFYQTDTTNQPNDMGYWIGKRIAKAYYERAENKKEALITLINLKDANAIYKVSKYNP